MDSHRYLSGSEKAVSPKLNMEEKQVACKLIIVNALET